MKAILIIALFAIATQASVLSQEQLNAYETGFIDALNVTADQKKAAHACYDAIINLPAELAKDLQTKTTGDEKAMEGLRLLLSLKNTIVPACSAYLAEVNTVVRQHNALYPSDTYIQIIKRNFGAHAAASLHELAVAIDAASEGKFYEAGKAEATLYQILLGVEVPKPVSTVDFSKVKFVSVKNQTEASIEMTEALFRGLGVSESTIKRLTQSVVDRQAIQEAIIQFQTEFRSSHDLIHRIELITNLINYIPKYAKDVQVQLEVVAPIFNKFKRNPVHFVLTVLHNTALFAPELQQSSMVMTVDMLEGHYKKAGEEYAKFYQLIGRGL